MLSLYLPSLPLHQQLIKVQLNKGAASTLPFPCKMSDCCWQASARNPSGP